jgi:hypothetical protein
MKVALRGAIAVNPLELGPPVRAMCEELPRPEDALFTGGLLEPVAEEGLRRLYAAAGRRMTDRSPEVRRAVEDSATVATILLAWGLGVVPGEEKAK